MRNLERLIELWHEGGPNLNAGCGHAGTCLPPPFINLDLIKRNGWDDKPHCIFELGDVRSLNHPDNIFGVIFASELIEHLIWEDADKTLREFYRTLKPGGCLKICTRDFKWVVDLYMGNVKHKDYDKGGGLLALKGGVIHGRMGPIWQTLYGHQSSTPEKPANVGHQTVWDYELLKWRLEIRGFTDIEKVGDKKPWGYPDAGPSDLVVEAWK